MDSTTNPAVADTPAEQITERGKDYLGQVQQLTSQPAVRRALPAILLVVVAIGGLILYTFLSQPSRLTLYSDLPEADKARAIEVLNSNGIDATVDQATGAMRVTQSDYHRARMILATEGLPAGTPDGMTTLAEMPMGASRSVEAARLRRMHELDLARSITEFQNVSSARVHLALPEQTAFIRDTNPPRASVFVQLASGRALDAGQVSAIVSLVSTSVPGMSRSQVSVVDQNGRLLSRESNNPLTEMTDQQLDYRKRMEDHYRQRIEALLSPIVGPGNVAAEVTVDMNFTRSEIMDERYNPKGSAIRSEQEQMQESTSQQARGIPGAMSNTPPQEAQLIEEGFGGGSPSESSNVNSSSTRNYEISRRVETITPASSSITRIHAAVLLRSPEGSVNEDGELIPGALPDSVLEDAEALIRSAIGFQRPRGDTVTLSAQPFMDSFSTVTTPWYQEAWLQNIARYGAQVVILAIVVLGLIKPIVDRLLFTPASAMNPTPTSAAIAAANGGGSSGGGSAVNGMGEAIEVGPGETLAEVRARLDGFEPVGNPWSHISYEEKLSLLRDLTQTDGDRIATAFKSMIEDDESKMK